MKAILLLSAVSAAAADRFVTRADSEPAFDVELVRHVNSQNAGWTATEEPYPLFAKRTHGEAKKLMGTRLDRPNPKQRQYNTTNMAVPDSFDSRTNWPHCPTISTIRDQSACGSCWAFGAAESMSDRYCTYFGATNPRYMNVSIAAGQLMSCCDSCGDGCDGGYPSAAWDYWVNNALVDNTCSPYPFPACAHHTTSPNYPPCPSSIYPTPSCPSNCANGQPTSAATQYSGANSWGLSGEAHFQAELMKNGPFEVSMSVYADFEQYKSGIYKHVSGAYLGGHAIRIVGWGVENGVKFWNIANSWNPSWGENGYFRIVRGVNECGIESQGNAGQPAQVQA